MLYTKDEMLAMAKSAPDVAALDIPPGGHWPWHDLEALRKVSGSDAERAALPAFGPVPDTVEEFETEVTLRDGTKMPVSVSRPKKTPEGGSPLAIYFFGGGFQTGSYYQGVFLNRLAASQFGVCAVSANYRTSPEHPFPTPQFDSYDNLKWAVANAEMLKANPNKGIFLQGASAGGQIATVVARHWAEDGHSPPITGLYLNVPYLFQENQTPEKYKEWFLSINQEEMLHSDILSKTNIPLIESRWKPDSTSTWSSIFAQGDPAKGMPPKVYMQAYGQDPIRDQCFIFEDVLREAGHKAKVDVYPGMFHAFTVVLPQSPMLVKLLNDGVKGWAFLLDCPESEVKHFLM